MIDDFISVKEEGGGGSDNNAENWIQILVLMGLAGVAGYMTYALVKKPETPPPPPPVQKVIKKIVYEAPPNIVGPAPTHSFTYFDPRTKQVRIKDIEDYHSTVLENEIE